MTDQNKIMNNSSPFFFDGAFGTYYYKQNQNEEPCEYGNQNNEQAVYKIHLEYIQAGVNAIKTNTFGANSLNFPDVAIRNTIIRKGYEIACRAVAGTAVKVFADIGTIEIESIEATEPEESMASKVLTDISDLAEIIEATETTESVISLKSSNPLKPVSESTKDIDGNSGMNPVQKEYLSIASEFLKLGATNFLFETLSEYENIVPAVIHIKSTCPEAFIVVSFAVSQDGFTNEGLFYKNLLNTASLNPGIDVLGLNCVCGPAHLYGLLRDVKINGKPLCAMPNSGYPATINGRTVFRDNSEYFAQRLKDISDLGIKFLGGCCGTTPEHLRAAIVLTGEGSLIKTTTSPKKSDGLQLPEKENIGPQGTQDSNATKEHDKKSESVTDFSDSKKVFAAKSFYDKLANNERVIAVEIDPPADTDVKFIMEACAKAKAANADLITVADSPLARPRADSIMLAAKIKRELSIDVLPHISCRDKNHIGIKSSLLGAAIENIRNVLVVTGDPIPTTDRADVKGVFSFNSFSLISYVKTLNADVFPGTPLTICAALNVNSLNFKVELARAVKKQGLGAEIFFTQPIFSQESVHNLDLARQTLKSKIMVGLMPVASYRNAMFLNNEVSGINIPENFVDQLKDKSPEEVFELSLDFEMNLVKQTCGYADGYYVMTPLRRIELVCDLIKRINSLR